MSSSKPARQKSFAPKLSIIVFFVFILVFSTGIAVAATINGTNNNDNLTGTAQADTINALNGNDTVNGLGGDDKIYGSNGDDTLNGGDGNDLLDGNNNNDTLNGGLGNDTITGLHGTDTIDGGDGDNVIDGGNDNDKITAGSGNDTITDENGNEIINAGDGNNTVKSGNGNDSVTTGSGNDTVEDTNGDDTVNTGAGRDVVSSGTGTDTVNLGAGSDTHIGDNGKKTVSGGDDSDELIGGDGNDVINGDGGNDYAIGGGTGSVTSGGPGADIVVAGPWGSPLYGNDGDDILYNSTGWGNIRVDGGNGNDICYGYTSDTFVGCETIYKLTSTSPLTSIVTSIFNFFGVNNTNAVANINNAPAVVTTSTYNFSVSGKNAARLYCLTDFSQAPVDCSSGSYQVTFLGPGERVLMVFAVGTKHQILSSVAIHRFTVAQTPAATLSVPGNITVEATGPAGATAVYPQPTAQNAQGQSIPVSCDKASGSTFALGTTTVNCTALQSGVFAPPATASFSVTVKDTTAPVLSGLTNIVREATGVQTEVTYTQPTAQDLVSGSVAVTCTPASGVQLGLGTASVTCQAVDAAGNTKNGGFTVTVKDTVAPVITAEAVQLVTAPDTTGAKVTVQAEALDAIQGAVAVTCNIAPGTKLALGEHAFTCTATDSSGNTASKSGVVRVGYSPAGGSGVALPANENDPLYLPGPNQDTGVDPVNVSNPAPLSPQSSDNKADYHNTGAGYSIRYSSYLGYLKEEITVTQHQGQKTWAWELIPGAGGQAPTLQSNGTIKYGRDGLAKVLAPVLLSQSGQNVTPQGLGWHISGNVISLTFNDNALALPYVVDPTLVYPQVLYPTQFCKDTVSSTCTGNGLESWRTSILGAADYTSTGAVVTTVGTYGIKSGSTAAVTGGHNLANDNLPIGATGRDGIITQNLGGTILPNQAWTMYMATRGTATQTMTSQLEARMWKVKLAANGDILTATPLGAAVSGPTISGASSAFRAHGPLVFNAPTSLATRTFAADEELLVMFNLKVITKVQTPANTITLRLNTNSSTDSSKSYLDFGTPPPPPVLTLAADPGAAVTEEKEIDFAWTNSGGAAEQTQCQVDGDGWETCSNATSENLNDVDPGAHEFEVRALNANPTSGQDVASGYARHTWVVEEPVVISSVTSAAPGQVTLMGLHLDDLDEIVIHTSNGTFVYPVNDPRVNGTGTVITISDDTNLGGNTVTEVIGRLNADDVATSGAVNVAVERAIALDTVTSPAASDQIVISGDGLSGVDSVRVTLAGGQTETIALTDPRITLTGGNIVITDPALGGKTVTRVDVLIGSTVIDSVTGLNLLVNPVNAVITSVTSPAPDTIEITGATLSKLEVVQLLTHDSGSGANKYVYRPDYCGGCNPAGSELTWTDTKITYKAGLDPNATSATYVYYVLGGWTYSEVVGYDYDTNQNANFDMPDVRPELGVQGRISSIVASGSDEFTITGTDLDKIEYVTLIHSIVPGSSPFNGNQIDVCLSCTMERNGQLGGYNVYALDVTPTRAVFKAQGNYGGKTISFAAYSIINGAGTSQQLAFSMINEPTVAPATTAQPVVSSIEKSPADGPYALSIKGTNLAKLATFNLNTYEINSYTDYRSTKITSAAHYLGQSAGVVRWTNSEILIDSRALLEGRRLYYGINGFLGFGDNYLSHQQNAPGYDLNYGYAPEITSVTSPKPGRIRFEGKGFTTGKYAVVTLDNGQTAILGTTFGTNANSDDCCLTSSTWNVVQQSLTKFGANDGQTNFAEVSLPTLGGHTVTKVELYDGAVGTTYDRVECSSSSCSTQQINIGNKVFDYTVPNGGLAIAALPSWYPNGDNYDQNSFFQNQTTVRVVAGPGAHQVQLIRSTTGAQRNVDLREFNALNFVISRHSTELGDRGYNAWIYLDPSDPRAATDAGTVVSAAEDKIVIELSTEADGGILNPEMTSGDFEITYLIGYTYDTWMGFKQLGQIYVPGIGDVASTLSIDSITVDPATGQRTVTGSGLKNVQSILVNGEEQNIGPWYNASPQQLGNVVSRTDTQLVFSHGTYYGLNVTSLLVNQADSAYPGDPVTLANPVYIPAAADNGQTKAIIKTATSNGPDNITLTGQFNWETDPTNPHSNKMNYMVFYFTDGSNTQFYTHACGDNDNGIVFFAPSELLLKSDLVSITSDAFGGKTVRAVGTGYRQCVTANSSSSLHWSHDIPNVDIAEGTNLEMSSMVISQGRIEIHGTGLNKLQRVNVEQRDPNNNGSLRTKYYRDTSTMGTNDPDVTVTWSDTLIVIEDPTTANTTVYSVYGMRDGNPASIWDPILLPWADPNYAGAIAYAYQPYPQPDSF